MRFFFHNIKSRLMQINWIAFFCIIQAFERIKKNLRAEQFLCLLGREHVLPWIERATDASNLRAHEFFEFDSKRPPNNVCDPADVLQLWADSGYVFKATTQTEKAAHTHLHHPAIYWRRFGLNSAESRGRHTQKREHLQE